MRTLAAVLLAFALCGFSGPFLSTTAGRRTHARTPDVSVSYSGLVIYVATTGNDSTGDGSEGAPYATLSKARDAIRAATSRTTDGTSSITGAWNGATVVFAAGTYVFASPVAFDERDSGTSTHPIVYRSAIGASVVFTGAYQVPNGSWSAVTSSDTTPWGLLPTATRASTYKLDVSSLGISEGLLTRNIGSDQDDVLRVIDDGAWQPMARWPDGDEETSAGWVKCTAATNNADTLTFSGTTIAGWSVSGQDPFIYGPLVTPYNIDRAVPTAFTSVSGSTRVDFSIGSTVSGVVPSSSQLPYIAALNMLQALNTAGEYVWNITNHMLYYLPAAGGAPSGVSLNLASSIATFGAAGDSSQAANWITLQDITLEGTRTVAVRADYSTGFVLDGCEVRNVGGQVGAVHIQDSTQSGLVNCSVHDTAVGAIMLHGGDHEQLDDAQNFITTTSVYAIGREYLAHISFAIQTGKSGSSPTGAGSGLIIDGLNLHDCRDSAVSLYCARLEIRNSTFDKFCTIVGDSGGLSGGFFLTGRHGIIENNTFENQRRLGDVSGDNNDFVHPSFGALNALYLDMLGGWTIQDNTFINCDHAMLFGAGKDHIIRRNKFTGCNVGFYQAPIVFGGRSAYEGTVTQQVTSDDLEAVPLDASPWTTDFPLLIQYRGGANHGELGGGDDGARRPILLYPENITCVDNMAVDGTYMTNLRSGAQQQTISGFAVGVDMSQLNYPIGDAGTPTNGGGSVALSTLDFP